MSRHELSKLRKKIEKEKEEFNSVIKEINSIEKQREDLINKIENIKNDIYNIPSVGKKYLGSDGRKYKYYYFPWMNSKIYIKIFNKNNENNNYEWREINIEHEIKNLIERLSDKGIKESNLKNKIKRFLPKKNNKHYNEVSNVIIPMTMEELFKNKVLFYINYSNQLRNKENNKNELKTKKKMNMI